MPARTLLRDIPQMERMARTVVDAVRLPVNLENAPRLGREFHSDCRSCPAHRTMRRAGARRPLPRPLAGPQRRRRLVVDSQSEGGGRIPVILNGDVHTPQDVARAFDETGCDAVMIGRAAIQNPWIFQEAKRYLQTGEVPPPATLHSRIETCLRHLRLTLEYKFPERRAVMEFRKYYAGYLRGLPNIAKVRAELMQFNEVAPIESRLLRLEAELDEVPFIDEARAA